MNRLNQQHGYWFEDFVRQTNGCLGIPRIDGPFDVPAVYNKEFGLNVSVKTVRERGSATARIGLASAPRFAAINEAYQMVVGVHHPILDGKMFTKVFTYVVSKEKHKELLGGLTYEEMLRYDAWIKSYRPNLVGDVMAREYAMKTREGLHRVHRPLVEMAYKINGANRRLQFELDLSHLESALVRTDTVSYRGTELPLFYRPGV